MNLRIKFIQFLLSVNEKLFFFQRLTAYYKTRVSIDNPVIIDVGANNGQTIDYFLKKYRNASIYAFEPNPKLFIQLKRKYKAYHQVQLFPQGVSNVGGRRILNETIIDETSTFEELNLESDYLKTKSKILGIKPNNMIVDSYSVDVICLGNFIKQMQLQHIHILKIDTEGHEFKCVQGLFVENDFQLDYIQLEYHNDDMYVKSPKYSMLVELLCQHGYVLDTKIKHGFGNIDELLFQKIK